MSRWLPAAAVGALLAFGVVCALLVLRPGPDPSMAERAEALAAELRCPDCQGLSVADSPTTSAREIRRQIDAMLADGAASEEVRAHFTARYGQWILLAPSSPLVWVLPFVVVALGVVGLGAWLVSRREAVPAAVEPALSDADRQRIHEEAEALDA